MIKTHQTPHDTYHFNYSSRNDVVNDSYSKRASSKSGNSTEMELVGLETCNVAGPTVRHSTKRKRRHERSHRIGRFANGGKARFLALC